MSKSCIHHRLDALDFLDTPDWEQLDHIVANLERAEAGDLVILEKQTLNLTRIVMTGWGFRYRSLPDGQRQILNFILPGDIVGFHAMVIAQTESGLEALTDMTFASFPSREMVELHQSHTRLMLALSWIAGQSERILDEQITRIGSRNARNRMAHLLVELYIRLRQAGFGREEAALLPITQAVLADALGMSAVHANRSFRALQKQGLVDREEGFLRLVDISALSRFAHFDHEYLEPDEMPPPTLTALNESELVN